MRARARSLDRATTPNPLVGFRSVLWSYRTCLSVKRIIRTDADATFILLQLMKMEERLTAGVQDCSQSVQESAVHSAYYSYRGHCSQPGEV